MDVGQIALVIAGVEVVITPRIRIDVVVAIGREHLGMKAQRGCVEPDRRGRVVDALANVGLDLRELSRQAGLHNGRLDDAEQCEDAVGRGQGHEERIGLRLESVFQRRLAEPMREDGVVEQRAWKRLGRTQGSPARCFAGAWSVVCQRPSQDLSAARPSGASAAMSKAMAANWASGMNADGKRVERVIRLVAARICNLQRTQVTAKTRVGIQMPRTTTLELTDRFDATAAAQGAIRGSHPTTGPRTG